MNPGLKRLPEKQSRNRSKGLLDQRGYKNKLEGDDDLTLSLWFE